jgi:hypothetical protein
MFRSYNDYQGTSNVFTMEESVPKVLKHNRCTEKKYIEYYEISYNIVHENSLTFKNRASYI